MDNDLNKADSRERLDIYLCSKGFAQSREKAKLLISGNCVFVDNILVNKPSAKVAPNSSITIIRDSLEYVGRGAKKLEKAVTSFKIDVSDSVAVDIGASTGGFTDYLLKNGIKKVYAVDVGHGQLHESLLSNEKVINIENSNFRYIDPKLFKETIDIFVIDVSFISLNLILPKIVEISNKRTNIVALIKPQFEAGKENVRKNGIVSDKKIHLMVLNNFREYCLLNGLQMENITFSPIRGGSGNIEYLAHLKMGNETKYENEYFKSLIKEAFESLNNMR